MSYDDDNNDLMGVFFLFSSFVLFSPFYWSFYLVRMTDGLWILWRYGLE